MKEHSGVDTSFWSNVFGPFGRYKGLVITIVVCIVIFIVLLVFCSCCCIPLARSLTERALASAVMPLHDEILHLQQQLLLPADDEEDM